MARLLVQLVTLCRPERARGLRLSRPLGALTRGDGDGVAGAGWYESSLDLQRGLLVRESGPDDRLLREWHQARRRLASTQRRAHSAPSAAHRATAEFEFMLPDVVVVAVPDAVPDGLPDAVPEGLIDAAHAAPAHAARAAPAAGAAAPRVRYPGGLDFVV